MQIIIKTLSGRKLSLEFDPTQKVIEIKQTLQQKEGIPVAQIRLISAGQVLKDDLTIEQAKITPGTTLMMMMHLKGGK